MRLAYEDYTCDNLFMTDLNSRFENYWHFEHLPYVKLKHTEIMIWENVITILNLFAVYDSSRINPVTQY